MRPPVLSWIFVAVAAIGWPMAATPAADGAAAVAPSRAELLHQWDLNKDGTIDESEAEVARAKMRRARLELQQDATTTKPLFPDAKEEDSSAGPRRRDVLDPLKRDRADGDPLGEAFRPVKPPTPKADGDRPGSKSPGQDRGLNAGRPMNDGRRMPNAPTPREKMGTGGVVTGGVRAGAPAIRPGYGASGPKVDLNAGRLPAGLPPAQGMRPQVGSAPFRTGLPGVGQDRGSDPRGTAARPGAVETPRPPLVPSSPTRVTAEDIGLP